MRDPNWAADMNAAIEDSKKREYRIGEWDCAIFISKVHSSITGEKNTHTEKFAGRYKTQIGYLRVLKRDGYEDLRDYLFKTFGNPVIHARAWRGDIALFEGSAGINVGEYSLFIGCEGLDYQPMSGSNLIAISNKDIKEFFRVR